MYSEYFIKGFEKRAWVMPVLKAGTKLLSTAAKNPLKTLTAVGTAAELKGAATKSMNKNTFRKIKAITSPLTNVTQGTI